jgi:hypothetical protein
MQIIVEGEVEVHHTFNSKQKAEGKWIQTRRENKTMKRSKWKDANGH